MRVLALDAATEACSVALLDERGLIERYSEGPAAQGEEILITVDAVLGEAGISLAQLDGIAASIGPGAFTGVRITVSVAQGLAFGAGLPVVGISTLEALALKALEPAGGCEAVLACLDARMGELYWGCFAPDARRGVRGLGALRVSRAAAVLAPAAARYRGIGRGFAAYPELGALAGLELEPADREALPEARHMARLGALRLAAGEGIDAAQLMPEYVRDKVALTAAERGP